MRTKLLFLMLLSGLFASAQTDLYNPKIVSNVSKVLDTTNLQPLFKRTTDNRIVRMSWSDFASYLVSTAATPDLQAVTVQGNSTTLPISVGVGSLNSHAVQKQQLDAVKDSSIKGYDLPENFVIATSNLTNTGGPLWYVTDTPRTINIQDFTPGLTLKNSNEIVRNGNDLWISYNQVTGPNNVIVHLPNCRIVDNVLKFDTPKYKVFSTGIRIHGSKFSRGFIWLTSRPNDVTVPTIVFKINAYNMDDFRQITLPATNQYFGNATELIAYKDKIFLCFRKDETSVGSFVTIDEDLNYQILFTYGSSSTNHALHSAPFEIYNDEIYVCTGDFTNLDTRSNKLGVDVYSLSGILKRRLNPIVVTTGKTTAITPHWVGIFNGKLIVSTANGTDVNVARVLLRFDTQTLALEENYTIDKPLTDDNLITSTGLMYLGNESTGSGYGINTVKYNDFSSYQLLDTFTTAGLITYPPYRDRLKINLSDFNNDIGAGSATNLSYTASPANGIVSSSTGSSATIPTATTTNAGLLSPAGQTVIQNTSGTNTGDNSTNTTSNAYADAKVQNNLTASTTIAPSATAVNTGLSAKLNLTGGTLTGTLTGQSISPSTSDTYNLGNSSMYYNVGYLNNLAVGNIRPRSTNITFANASFVAMHTMFLATGNTTFGGTVDAGYKLDVQGTGRFTGEVTAAPATASTNLVTLSQLQAITPLTASATLDFPSTSGQNSQDITISLTGAIVGKPVNLGVPSVSVLPNSCFTAWVSAADVVTVRFNNYTSTTQNPAAGAFTVQVSK